MDVEETKLEKLAAPNWFDKLGKIINDCLF